MNSFRLGTYALSGGVAVALLGGCGGSPPQSGTSSALPLTSALAAQPIRGTSWMAPDAGSIKRLLYVSLVTKGVVEVYNYKTGAQVGKLSGLVSPQGQCVDAKGDVFIADYGVQSIVEYAHGGSKPLSTLQTEGSPTACSVSADDDLAVVNVHTSQGNQGEVVIFKNASGPPTVYTNSSCYTMAQLGYDHAGNLYVIASPYTSSGQNQVCEIPKGSSSLKPVSQNADLSSPLGLMWDGLHITLADQNYTASSDDTIIYQMKESTSGNLRVVGKTTLNNSECDNEAAVAQPFIVGAKNTPVNTELGSAIVGPDGLCDQFDFWSYPKGGSPLKSLKGSLAHVAGQAVSIAP